MHYGTKSNVGGPLGVGMLVEPFIPSKRKYMSNSSAKLYLCLFFCLYSSLKSKSKALSNSSCMIKPKTTRSLEGVRGVTLTLNGFKRANMQVISLCIIKHKAQPDIPIHPHHSSYSDDLTSPSKE